jgi:bifunctional UDP-N-acetylglucosamine pyrophosphorylase/glucosamine-1-phosphate N-acetyltransferase
LQKLAGCALLQHVLDRTAALAAAQRIVITGHGADEVEAAMAASGAVFVRQMPQLGTGHAIQQTVPRLPDSGTTLILSGDTPLITAETTRRLVEACGGEQLVLLTIDYSDPTGYGRIVREGEAVKAIVEHKDASAEQRLLRECYTGIMAVPTARLKRWVMALNNDNVQREFYLTDIVKMAVAEGVPVVGVKTSKESEVLGVNSPRQLAELERLFQTEQAEALMEAGVRMADPARFDLRGTLECGEDVEIDVNCVFEGHVLLGKGVRIGANCFIRNARIAEGAQIQPFTHIDGEALGVKVGAGALIGPFARLRPGAELGAEVHIGNFVEVKNSTLARGAKANHLAYLGDATVGERVNFGAGSITANYDGANKHRTVIEADVHVGSNCVLIAPVTLGAGGTIGGGSTIAKDTPPGQLTVARAKQVSISSWKRPVKQKK